MTGKSANDFWINKHVHINWDGYTVKSGFNQGQGIEERCKYGTYLQNLYLWNQLTQVFLLLLILDVFVVVLLHLIGLLVSNLHVFQFQNTAKKNNNPDIIHHT